MLKNQLSYAIESMLSKRIEDVFTCYSTVIGLQSHFATRDRLRSFLCGGDLYRAIRELGSERDENR